MKNLISRISSFSGSGQRKKTVACHSNLPIKPPKKPRVHYDEGLFKSISQSQFPIEGSDPDSDSSEYEENSRQRKKSVTCPSNLPNKPSKQSRGHYNEGFLKSHSQSQILIEGSNSDSDSDSYSSESEEISTNNTKKVRGKTVLSRLWNYDGPPKPVEFNAYGQCVDDGELGRFCGTIARNAELTPLEYLDWRKFPSDKKEAIWEIVKAKYDVPLNGKKWVLGKVGSQLRCFKNDLFDTNFHKYSSLTDLQKNPDHRTSKEQWKKLVEKWYPSEWQKKSQIGKESQRRSKLQHSSGTISFVRRSEIEFKKTVQKDRKTSK